jgi:hypothetical protein
VNRDYERKLLPSGRPAQADHGTPSLLSLLAAAFPGQDAGGPWLHRVICDGPDLRVELLPEPDDQAAAAALLDAAYAAWAPLPFPPQSEFLVSAALLPGELEPEGEGWVEVGSVVTAPSAFSSARAADLSALSGKIIGQYRASAAGASVRIVEEKVGGADVEILSATLPSTGGAWSPFAVAASVSPRSGLNRYRLEVDRDGASAAWRSVSMTLVLVRPS